MKINNICSISFNAKIIDSHCHIGQWNENNNLKDYTKDMDIFIKNTLDNGDVVEKVIISNLDCMTKNNNGKFLLNEIDGNKMLADYSRNNSKIAPLLTCQPGQGSVNNIKNLFSENPKTFVGLKFHPEQIGIVANDIVYEPYLEFAKNKKLPCLFHSGGTKVSNPKAILNLAEKFPEVDIIIAHWGAECGGDYDLVTDIIIDSVKNKKSKIYADISWIDCNDQAKPTLKKIIKRLKEENALDRILFGSDAPLGRFGGNGENNIKPMQAYTQTIQDIKNMIKKEYSPSEADEIIEKIFYKNSKDLFFKNNKTKSGLKNKKYIIFIGALITLCTIGGCFFNRNKKQEVNKKHLSSIA